MLQPGSIEDARELHLAVALQGPSVAEKRVRVIDDDAVLVRPTLRGFDNGQEFSEKSARATNQFRRAVPSFRR